VKYYFEQVRTAKLFAPYKIMQPAKNNIIPHTFYTLLDFYLRKLVNFLRNLGRPQVRRVKYEKP